MNSPRPRRSLHGSTLIEGMVAMAVLTIGILGAFQGILFASQQNAVAMRIARSTSMGSQVRQGLEGQGRAKLMAAVGGILGDASICVAGGTATTQPLSDGLSAVAGSCVVDLDAYDSGASVVNRVVAKYDFTHDYTGNNGQFRRVLVYLPAAPADNVAVVVSTKDVGRRVFVKQLVTLYDSSQATGNGTGVDL